MWRTLFALVLVLGAPVAEAAVPLDVVRGTITQVTTCGANTQLIRIVEQSTPLIVGSTTVTYGTVRPTQGFVVFGVTEGSTTCISSSGSVSGTKVTHIVYAEEPVTKGEPLPQDNGTGGGSGGSQGSGSSFDNLLKKATDKAQGYLDKLLNPKPPQPTPTTPTQPTQPGAPSAPPGIPFGGPITKLIPCSNGAIYVILGPPTPGPYVWMPGTISYQYGPPAFVGQHLLGAAAPGGVCKIGTTFLYGQRIIFHGSSGPILPSTPSGQKPKQEQETQTSCTSGKIETAAQKAAAERQVRATLAACGVRVNKGACPFGTSFRSVSGGCTDVGALQCGTTNYICDLAKKCGPFTLTGGSEAGHKTHGGGGAFDVVGIDECIKRNFEEVRRCRYRDPATGTTFLDEGQCPVGGTTGPHIHVCVGGKGC
ncbi:MAG: hypothetical protein NBV63_02210 [Candidatus Pacebacteria bacterium]|nr:hypothetical protein [Candidatus Paceibacterota bacterium]